MILNIFTNLESHDVVLNSIGKFSFLKLNLALSTVQLYLRTDLFSGKPVTPHNVALMLSLNTFTVTFKLRHKYRAITSQYETFEIMSFIPFATERN